MIVFTIWNWEAATRFWNEHSNYDRKRLVKANEELADKVRAEVAEHQETKEQLQAAMDNVCELDKSLHEATSRITDLTGKTGDLQRENERMRQEIMELKAKLYNLMIEKVG